MGSSCGPQAANHYDAALSKNKKKDAKTTSAHPAKVVEEKQLAKK